MAEKLDYNTFEDPEVAHNDSRSPNSNTFSGVYTAEDRQRVRQMYSGKLVFPWQKSYKCWWGLTVVSAIFTLFFVTYQIGFAAAGLYTTDAASSIEYSLLAIFVLDIMVQFNLAFYNSRDEVCCDRAQIAQRYMKGMFWMDLVGVLPFYPLALAIAGELHDSTTSQFLAFFRLIRLVRLHRLRDVLEFLQYTTSISLLWLTMLRNFAVALVWTHVAACIMYFIARQYNFSEETWLGPQVRDLTPFERYSTSMYWSVVTFTTGERLSIPIRGT